MKTEATTDESVLHPWSRKPAHQEIPLALVRNDGNTQQRVGPLNAETIEEMAAVVVKAQSEDDGDLIDHPFAWIDVYEDEDGHFWLADGHYRCAAYEMANVPVIGAAVRRGTQRDAVLHSCHANAQHGTRRTSDDKRKAVTTMLSDETWRAMSNQAIAEICQVSDWLVGDVRKSLIAENPEMASTTRKGRDGREYDTNKLKAAGAKGAAKTNNAKTAKADDEAEAEAAPSPEPEPAKKVNPEDDLTDDEWLNSLPIYSLLKAVQESPAHFEGCALSWRTLSQVDFFATMRRHLSAFGKDQDDDLVSRYKYLLAVPHPSKWSLCSHCEGSTEIKVDGNNRYMGPASIAQDYRIVTCNCEGGYIFDGGGR